VDASTTRSGANVFYDGGQATEVSAGPGTRVERRTPERPFSWFLDHRTLDWGRSWLPEPRATYDADRGLVLTAGLTYDRYGFLKEPYSDRLRLRLGWSFGLSEPFVDYRHHFRGLLAGRDLRIEGRWSGIELIDYHGLGNETSSPEPDSFYRVVHKQLSVAAYASFGDGERRRLSVGPAFDYLSTDTTGTSTFLAVGRPYGSGRFSQVGLRAAFEVNGRDREGTPTEGYFLEGGGAFFPAYLDVDRGAVRRGARTSGGTYLSPFGSNPTLALRAHAKKVWGPSSLRRGCLPGWPEQPARSSRAAVRG
jgi:hypothetical protein